MKAMEYKSNNNVVYSCKYPVEWCPQYRRPVLTRKVESDLKRILHCVAQERHAGIIKREVMPEHVHLLVEVDPQYGVHRLVKQMKGRSSRMLRVKHKWLKSRIPSLWTNSYLISTVGGAPLKVIKQYLESRKEV
jgi:putative transposase